MRESQQFQVSRLANGLTLLGEPMEAVSSAAFAILVPMGSATDPEGSEGAAALLAELYNKGAGKWDSRELSEQFEDIGVQRSHNSGIEISIFSGASLGKNLAKALELYSAVLLEPLLPAAELESVKQLALQDLEALEDEPASKAMNELAKHFYPYPFGRSQLGTKDGISNATLPLLKQYYKEALKPNNALIAVAGAFDWHEIEAVVERCFGGWAGSSELLPLRSFPRGDKAYHLRKETAQLQIALAYPSVTLDDPDYYTAKVAVAVLSGGMSGRLFIEVREKRGLVYRVSASHSAARGRGAIFASAGTTPENGEETLRVMLEELRNVGKNVSEEELARAKADLKSRLIMQSELSSVRSSALVNDWWNLGRLRTLEEIKQGIDAVTPESIARFAAEHPVADVTMVTLGGRALEVPR